MKKYFFPLLLFIIFLISIYNVNAATVNPPGWAMNISYSSIVNAFDCSSTTNCTTALTVNSLTEYDTQDNFVIGSYSYIPSVTTNNVGFLWTANVNSTLKSGYLYNVTGYFCNNNSKSYVLKNISTANNQSDLKTDVHPLTADIAGAINTISNQPYYNGSASSNISCSYISRFIVPSVNSQYIGWNISTDGNMTGSQYYYGYTVSELGVYQAATKSDIQSAISGSGLASAQSVQDVETAVSNVQHDLQSSTDSINDSIENSEVNILTGVADGISSVNGNLAQESQNIQNGVKEGFESCRDSYNLFNPSYMVETQYSTNGSVASSTYTLTDNNIITYTNLDYGRKFLNKLSLEAKTYTLSGKILFSNNTKTRLYYSVRDLATQTDIVSARRIDISSNPGLFEFSFSLSSASSNISISLQPEGSPDGTISLSELMLVEGSSAKPYEAFGQQVCKNRIDSTNEKLDDLNGTMNNSDVNGANSDASGFFSGFNSNTFGLSSIITMPLEFISHLTDSNTCNSLVLPLPFVNTNATLPCMTSIYNTYFHDFLVLYQTITTGFISYWVCVNIFRLVRIFKNPENDQVEVMEL